METGRDLDPWLRSRSRSRSCPLCTLWDDLRGGRRAEKPGEGPGAPGRAAGIRRVGVKQLLGPRASERAAARGRVWRELGMVGHPRGGITPCAPLRGSSGRVVQGSPP